jgi:hypothetical protein
MDRLDNHTDTYRKEIEGLVAAGLLIGASKAKMKASYEAICAHTIPQSDIQGCCQTKSRKAEVLVSKGLHLGVGISNSAFNSINTLGRYTIGDAWMYDWYDDWNTKGAIGYEVRRGSSYPCSICDSNVGFHTDGNLPPYHPRCVCIAIPVFA